MGGFLVYKYVSEEGSIGEIEHIITYQSHYVNNWFCIPRELIVCSMVRQKVAQYEAMHLNIKPR